jgi:hypothetical protein
MGGAAGGDRTHDPWLRRPILYPLSYSRNSKKTNTHIVAASPDDDASEAKGVYMHQSTSYPIQSPLF